MEQTPPLFSTHLCHTSMYFSPPTPPHPTPTVTLSSLGGFLCRSTVGWARLCYLNDNELRDYLPEYSRLEILFLLQQRWNYKVRVYVAGKDKNRCAPPLGMNANVGGPLYICSLSSASYWILYTVFLLSDWHLKRTTVTAKLSRGCFSHFYNSVIVWNIKRITQTLCISHIHTQTRTLSYKLVKIGQLKTAELLVRKSRCLLYGCIQKPVNRGSRVTLTVGNYSRRKQIV